MKLHPDIVDALVNKIKLQTQGVTLVDANSNEKDKYGLTLFQRQQLNLLFSQYSYAEGGVTSWLIITHNATYNDATAYVTSLKERKNNPNYSSEDRINVPPLCALWIESTDDSTLFATYNIKEPRAMLVLHGRKGFVLGPDGGVSYYLTQKDKFRAATEEEIKQMVDSFSDAQNKYILREPAFDEIRFEAMSIRDKPTSIAPIVKTRKGDLVAAYSANVL